MPAEQPPQIFQTFCLGRHTTSSLRYHTSRRSEALKLLTLPNYCWSWERRKSILCFQRTKPPMNSLGRRTTSHNKAFLRKTIWNRIFDFEGIWSRASWTSPPSYIKIPRITAHWQSCEQKARSIKYYSNITLYLMLICLDFTETSQEKTCLSTRISQEVDMNRWVKK